MSDMITNHADIDVFIGIDVGKHNHHAVALDRDGKQLLSKALLQNETKLRALLDRLRKHGTLLVVVDQPATFNARTTKRMETGARGFLDSIPALRNRECIICGEGVAIPIRATFDSLEEAKRPASADPSFMSLWREPMQDEGVVQRAVQRWRSQGK